jgi:hypothetical protein
MVDVDSADVDEQCGKVVDKEAGYGKRRQKARQNPKRHMLPALADEFTVSATESPAYESFHGRILLYLGQIDTAQPVLPSECRA